MTRPALAAARSVEILNFLASHPGESFTLSELSRHLNLNMASGLSVLKALTDAGYVHRHHSHKTYSLGPALVAVGYAALARYQVIEIALEEMRRLAAECDTECVASVVVGDEIVIVGASGRPRAGGPAGSVDPAARAHLLGLGRACAGRTVARGSGARCR